MSQSPSLGTKQINPRGAELAHVPGAVPAPASASGSPALPLAPGGPAGTAWLGHGRAGSPRCWPLRGSGMVALGAASSCFPGCSHAAPARAAASRGANLHQPPSATHLSPPQALANSTAEYESLESEVSALHDDLWEQLNLDIQVSGTPLAPGSPHHPWGPPPPSLWRWKPLVPSAPRIPVEVEAPRFLQPSAPRTEPVCKRPLRAQPSVPPFGHGQGRRGCRAMGAIEELQPSVPYAAGAPSAPPSLRWAPGGAEGWFLAGDKSWV